MVVKTSRSKWRLAIPAAEALWMPLSIESGDVILHDWHSTATTLWCKHLKVILPAVCFSVLFMEVLISKHATTLGTEEMFRVPHALQGCDAFVNNWSIAVCTARSKQIVVVLLAVGQVVTLVKVVCAERLLALSTDKMFYMPRPSKCSNHLSDYRLVAGSADSFFLRVYALSVHVRLKVTQHAIQV